MNFPRPILVYEIDRAHFPSSTPRQQEYLININDYLNEKIPAEEYITLILVGDKTDIRILNPFGTTSEEYEKLRLEIKKYSEQL
jgi:hypothetical protein